MPAAVGHDPAIAFNKMAFNKIGFNNRRMEGARAADQ
jgi:hypothetical protein